MSTISPKEYGRQLGVSENKVLAWIRSGQLKALNVASNLKNRPRWRITEAARAEFEAARTAGVVSAPARPARRPSYEQLI